ncbi:DotD/TraH family lipoprotein [Ramlibacter sp. AN1133]|uniref:DotD/TraH family lipoprotein n=1 Tax=Ramlibacter sp. AN1133 TaxID=3133429 RepID=UPI0030BDACF0
MHMRPGLPLLAALAVLAGCASTPLPPEPAAADESKVLLDGALQRAEVLPASTSSASSKAKPLNLQEARFSMNYAGEGKVLLKQVAAARGLTFRVLGPQPHLPLFVIVDSKDSTLEELLRDVGLQFGQRADLALTDKAIEVRYRAN